VLLLAVPRGAAAQTSEDIQAAVQLAQEGSSDSARARIQTILASVPTNVPVYAEALYAAGAVAATTEEAQRYYRRVALEFSYSPWADDALLRLAQIRYVSHDALGTVRAVERLLADYPASPLAATGAYWAARASIDLNDDEAACRFVNIGLGRATDVETANQLRYFSGRCDGGARAGNQAAAPAPAPAPPAVTGPSYRVQVVAVSSQDAAEDVSSQLRNLGYPVEVIQQDGLYKVRAGNYADRESADDAVRTIRSRLGGQPFVVVIE
jgi:hypothetical protein